MGSIRPDGTGTQNMDQEIPLKRVKTFLFDMGNVLVFFSHPIMCRQMAEVCGVSPPELKARVFDSALQWDFERGFLSEEEFHRTLEAIFEMNKKLCLIVVVFV